MRDEYWIIKSTEVESDALVIANEYLKSLKLRNRSTATIDKYRWVIEMFLTYDPKQLNKLEPDDVLNWLRNNHSDKKERTINLFISVLSGFFRFCLEEEYIDKVLIKTRWRPRIPESLPKFLDSHELAKVKLALEKMSIRDRALVEFLLTSGCRLSEVASLNIKDIDLYNRTAMVMGKGKKIREVHFSIECSILLRNYLREHKRENQALFINKAGNRLTGAGIYKMTIKLGEKAGLLTNLNPHKFRHSFASSMLAKRAELQFIADELGHVDLNTTRIYAKLLSQDIIDEYNKKMESI